MEVYIWGDLKQLLKAQVNSRSRRLVTIVVYFSHSPNFLYPTASHRCPCGYLKWRKSLTVDTLMFLLKQGRTLCTELFYILSGENKCPQCAELLEVHQDVPSAWNARWLEVRKYIDTWTMVKIWLESQTHERSSIRKLLVKRLGEELYNIILLNHKREWNLAISDDMDETRARYAKWNKSDRERQILYDCT